jgi:hypothetical protein
MMYLGFEKCLPAENTGMISSRRATHFCRTSMFAIEIRTGMLKCGSRIAAFDVEWEKHRKLAVTLGGQLRQAAKLPGKLQVEMFVLHPGTFDNNLAYPTPNMLRIGNFLTPHYLAS